MSKTTPAPVAKKEPPPSHFRGIHARKPEHMTDTELRLHILHEFGDRLPENTPRDVMMKTIRENDERDWTEYRQERINQTNAEFAAKK